MEKKIKQHKTGFNAFFTELQETFRQKVSEAIQTQLETDVTNWLYRSYDEKRESVTRQSQAQCQRCGNQKAQFFSRNGHRQRQLVTTFGVVTYGLPRVMCECGGSVRIAFSILQPYQRFWDDVVNQVGRWAELGLSLRQMQGEIGDQCRTQVGLRKLNEGVQDVDLLSEIELTSVPPIIMLDAIWVTILEDTETTQVDRLGRQGGRKHRTRSGY